jgi:hypothetical protein
MESGSADAPPVSVHFTRVDPPPPFPDPLHWVTVAPVVLATGAHTRIGWVPPPVPEPMHWFTVTPLVAVPAGMVFTTETLHVTLLPPPTTIPLHWLTVVTNWFEAVTTVVQPKGGSTPAAARHEVAVIVELGAPAELTLLATVILQLASNPAPVGKAGGSHCVAAGATAAGVAAEADDVPASPPRITMPKVVTATTKATLH